MHLPFPPELSSPGPAFRGVSRRRDGRCRARRLAWELTEWQIASFCYFELGAPKTTAQLSERLGRWKLAPRQEASFLALVHENLRWSRPHLGLTEPASGRGLARLQGLLWLREALEGHCPYGLRPAENGQLHGQTRGSGAGSHV